MSTRSYIGRLNGDGTVTAIYCHFDGYPEHVGRILARHYTDAAKVDALIALGSLLTIGAEIGTKHNPRARTQSECTAIGRDAGEADAGAVVYASRREFRRAQRDSDAEYCYLYSDGRWQCFDVDGWEDVAVVLAAIAEATP